MKNYILLILLSSTIIKTSGQTKNLIVNTLGLHYSFYGSNKLSGIDVNIVRNNKVSKSFDWFYGSTLTFHTGYIPVKVYSYGLQGETGITLKLFEKNLPINLSTGSIVRYRYTSVPPSKIYTLLPISFTQPPNTISIGYKVQLELGMIKIRKSRVFFNSYLQNDTNGDLISGLGFVFKNLNF